MFRNLNLLAETLRQSDAKIADIGGGPAAWRRPTSSVVKRECDKLRKARAARRHRTLRDPGIPYRRFRHRPRCGSCKSNGAEINDKDPRPSVKELKAQGYTHVIFATGLAHGHSKLESGETQHSRFSGAYKCETLERRRTRHRRRRRQHRNGRGARGKTHQGVVSSTISTPQQTLYPADKENSACRGRRRRVPRAPLTPVRL